MTNSNSDSPRTSLSLIGLWFLAAILEGIDLQSAGIAGPGIKAEFQFDAAQLGWVFTAGTFGLVVGAIIGGRLADRFGRKWILIISIVIFGAFSIATAQSSNIDTLLAFRVLTGLGLGGAIPNLIALVAESTPMANRNSIMGLMYCGMPLGSAIIAAIGWLELDQLSWRVVFYAGGIAPLVIAPLYAWALPESPVFAARKTQAVTASALQRTSNLDTLFKDKRWRISLALWLSSFCTYFVLYLLINWLPSLLLNKGFSGRSASAVMILFNLGGMFGIVLGGTLMDRLRHGIVIVVIYACLVAALVGLIYAQTISLILLAAFMGDLFVAATQMIQYSLAPIYYGPTSRGTAVGAMVAIGRTGSIAGPLTAGQLLAAGAAGSVVLSVGLPGLVASALALLIARVDVSPQILSIDSFAE